MEGQYLIHQKSLFRSRFRVRRLFYKHTINSLFYYKYWKRTYLENPKIFVPLPPKVVGVTAISGKISEVLFVWKIEDVLLMWN